MVSRFQDAQWQSEAGEEIELRDSPAGISDKPAGEECGDGSESADCATASCGDGYINTAAGEVAGEGSVFIFSRNPLAIANDRSVLKRAGGGPRRAIALA